MNRRSLFVLLGFAFCSFFELYGQNDIHFVQKDDQVDVMAGDKLITSFLYGDHLSKPMLYPVYAPSGAMITRSYPFKYVEGETHDHPHHTGVYFTYGSNKEVNGTSFWHNEHDKPPFDNERNLPQIRLIEMTDKKVEKGVGTLSSISYWVDKDDNPLLEESRTMEFKVQKKQYVIDFTIRLKAVAEDITFQDTKEGMFAVRVADWLAEDAPGTLYKSTGVYQNAEGLKTEENIWGKQSAWVQLQGEYEGRDIGVAVFHHPSSVNFPAYWHARGYGCFSANPIGRKNYEEGNGVKNAEERTLTIKKGESELFKFRLIIYEGAPGKKAMDKEFSKFKK